MSNLCQPKCCSIWKAPDKNLKMFKYVDRVSMQKTVKIIQCVKMCHKKFG